MKMIKSMILVGVLMLSFSCGTKQNGQAVPAGLAPGTAGPEKPLSAGGPASAPANVNNYSIINEANPGAPLDIKGYVQPGVTCIFDFFSEGCPPCRMLAPKLKELSEKRSDLVVMKIDINRKGIGGIDWGSPLVSQYGFNSIPYFVVYYPDGSSVKGTDATQAVFTMLSQAGIEL